MQKRKSKPPQDKLGVWAFWVFTSCSRIQFFNSLPFLTQLVRPPLVPYHLLSSTCMTYRTSYHSIGYQVLSTQPLPREAQDFPRGRKYPKDVPLLTSHLKVLPGRFYLGPRASHGNYISLSLVLNQLLNSLIVWKLLVFTNRPYSLLIICSL